MFTVFPLSRALATGIFNCCCHCLQLTVESIRPGLVQGCKAPNGVAPSGLLDKLLRVTLSHRTWSVLHKSAPARTGTHDCTIGPSQATPSLLIGVVLSTCTDRCGVVTNTSYDGMPTSLGIVLMLIHCLWQGSVADKPRLSQRPRESVADIADCATSPTLQIMRMIFLFKSVKH